MVDWQPDNLAGLAHVLFRESGDALILFDPETEAVLDANPLAQRLSGFSCADFLHWPVSHWIREEVPGTLDDLREAYRKTGAFHSPDGFSLRFRQEGVWIPVHLTVTQLKAGSRALGLITARDVTDRREVEAALRASEAKYRLIVENIREIVYQVTINDNPLRRPGTARFMSAQVESILGYAPREFADNPALWFSIVHPDDVPLLVETTEQIRRRREPGGREYRLRHKHTGEYRWMEDKVIPLTNPRGEVVGLQGVARDITERKQAQEMLLRSEERFRALVEKSAEAIALINPEGRVVFASASTERVLGYTPAEFTGQSIFDLFHPEDSDAMKAHFAEVLQLPGEPLVASGRVRHKDGGWRHVEGTATNRLEDRDLEAVIVNYRDVTGERTAQERVRHSEAKYRSLVENLEQCVFLKDRDLRFVAVNRPFCQSLGLTEDEVIGKTDLDFYPPHLAEHYRATDRRVLSEGRRVETEEENVGGGKFRTVRVVKTPVLDDAGQPVGVLGIFWDVTEQRRLEEALRQAQKMEAVGQLAGGVAHDFNNLLTAIIGNVSLILANLTPDHTARQWAQAVEKAALRGAHLTSQMLGFSRRMVLRPVPGNLNSVVDEVATLLRCTIDPRIDLDPRKAPDLWLVRADQGGMNQVLLNLCLNARDAMPEGGRLLIETANVNVDGNHARLQLDARPGEYVRLRVTDTGHGIPADVLPRIFDPFFTTKGPGKGTGLGLSMVYGIVRQHQGWVECQSEVGRGTTFDVYLPRLVRAELAPVPVETVPTPGRETVLLVDDEAILRELGRTILKSYGYDVLVAEDGLKAVEVYESERHRIDIVVLDLTMPRLSGRDAFRRLVDIDPDVRVLFVSGYSAEMLTDLEHECLVGFVPKPYRPEQLARAVREALDRTEVGCGS